VFVPMAFTQRPHSLRRFDLQKAHELGTATPVDGFFNFDALRPVVATPDGKRLVLHAASADKKEKRTVEPWIATIDLETGRPIGPRIELPRFDNQREALARKLLSVTEDGKYAVLDIILRPEGDDSDSSNHSERTLAWDLATGKELTLPTKFHRLAFSSDGRY